MGEEEGIPTGIHFCNICKESTLDDLYSVAQPMKVNMPKKGKIDLKKIEFNNYFDNDEIDDLEDEDAIIHLIILINLKCALINYFDCSTLENRMNISRSK